MAEQSAKSFLNLVERSGIVAPESLKASLSELSKAAAGQTVNTDQLAAHLIDSGLITDWHCEKIKAGKYKGFFLGKYKLLGHLGTGGMSSVYLAQHNISKQFRAIKVLPRKKVSDKSYLDRFYREGKAAASLNHPNIVRMYDICKDGNTHYMVMEYVQGIDLYEMVKADGPLSIEKSVEYTVKAAIGLSHAHERNLVHRDIKPANLLLADDGVVKLLDLGLALMREEGESLTVLYNEKVMGTADYLSPEQAVNSHEVDHRADIYSLGCTLYFFLTGHPPFPDGTLAQRIARHQTQEPADIRESRPDCPEALVEICRIMMKKDPDQRYQDCAEVAVALQAYASSGSVSLQPKPETATPAPADVDAASNYPELDLTTSGVATATGGGESSNDILDANEMTDPSSAKVRTDDISAIQTKETPVPQAVPMGDGGSPFNIDTSSSSKSVKQSSASSKKSTLSKKDLKGVKSLNVRKRKKTLPTWVIALGVALLLLAMVLVLVIVNFLISPTPSASLPTLDILASLASSVDLRNS